MAAEAAVRPPRRSSPGLAIGSAHGDEEDRMNTEAVEQPIDAIASREPPGVGFRHVLVCLDRSETAEAALPFAAHLARTDNARITLLHVLEAPPETDDIRATDAIAWDIAREGARAYLARVAGKIADLGVSPEMRVAEGTAASQIASLAAALDADLIVLSSHGEGGEGAWPLGSTAQKVLTLAQGSLLIVPSHRPDAAPRIQLKRIFVPLDGSIRAESVLPTAVRLARAEEAEVIVAHLTSDPIRTEVLFTEEDLALARELADRLTSRADAYVGQVRARLSNGGLHGVRVRAVTGRSTDHRTGLIALALSQRADLVVLSAHGSVCNARHRFGSVTSYFIAHSTVPVLVVQDLPGTSRSTPIPPTRPPPRSLDAGTPEN
jgi:nucleotide-binding universal stress UspA family protein